MEMIRNHANEKKKKKKRIEFEEYAKFAEKLCNRGQQQ